MADAETTGRCRGLLAVYALRMARLDQQANDLDGGEPSGGPSDRAGLSTPSEYLRGQREAIAWARELLEDALGKDAEPAAEQTTGEHWQDVARCVAAGRHQIDAAHLFTDCPVTKVVGTLEVTTDRLERGEPL